MQAFKRHVAQIHIGVCITDRKLATRPMGQIIQYLQGKGYCVRCLDDSYRRKVPPRNWPHFDVLLSFYSKGLDFLPVRDYAAYQNPVEINDVDMQLVLLDRRLVMATLDQIGIRTPGRIVYNGAQRARDSDPFAPPPSLESMAPSEPESGLAPETGPRFFAYPALNETLASLRLSAEALLGRTPERQMLDEDTLQIGDAIIKKPYVEKPVYSEDHNINLYYSSDCKGREGGVCKLFRKIGTKSSHLVKKGELGRPKGFSREGGAYIYEEYQEMQDFLDVKAYVIGKKVYAETRRSPVKDGIVVRDALGKEVRQRIELTEKEKEAVQKISRRFGQFVCGMDILRTKGEFAVIDVNGWSFVKTNPNYYKKNLGPLDRFIKKAVFKRERDRRGQRSWRKGEDKMVAGAWGHFAIGGEIEVRGVCSIYRHGSRTPKFKKRFQLHLALGKEPGGHPAKIMCADDVADMIKRSMPSGGEALEEAERLLSILEAHRNSKIKIVGGSDTLALGETASAAKPCALTAVVKWGGMLTGEAAQQIEYEAVEYEEELSKLYRGRGCMTEEERRPIEIYSNPEERALQTAEGFHRVLREQNKGVREIIKHCSMEEKVPEDAAELRELEEISEMYASMERRHALSETSAFSEKWAFLFKEFPALTVVNAKTVVPLLLDFINYDLLYHREDLLRFVPSLAGDRALLNSAASALFEQKQSLHRDRTPGTLKMLKPLIAGGHDFMYFTKRYNMASIILHVIDALTSTSSAYLNAGLIGEIRASAHDVDFLCNVMMVRFSDKREEYVMVKYSKGLEGPGMGGGSRRVYKTRRRAIVGVALFREFLSKLR